MGPVVRGWHLGYSVFPFYPGSEHRRRRVEGDRVGRLSLRNHRKTYTLSKDIRGDLWN